MFYILLLSFTYILQCVSFRLIIDSTLFIFVLGVIAGNNIFGDRNNMTANLRHTGLYSTPIILAIYTKKLQVSIIIVHQVFQNRFEGCVICKPQWAIYSGKIMSAGSPVPIQHQAAGIVPDSSVTAHSIRCAKRVLDAIDNTFSTDEVKYDSIGRRRVDEGDSNVSTNQLAS